MFQKVMTFGPNSYVEITSRIFNSEEHISIALVGPKNEDEITVSQVLLSDEQLKTLIQYLQEAQARKKSWPDDAPSETD